MVGVTASFTRDDWQQGYRSLKAEYAYWIDEVEGSIPPDLQGTLFRNGPGLLDANGQPYGHPFDGDGMVCAFTFAHGRAHFANSFVKTPEFLAEQRAGRILYRGVFGTQKPGGWLANCFDLRLKNIANTNVIYHGEKLLALWEASRPYRLDPATLDTLGIEDFGGALRPGQAFTAHPRLDPVTGNLWAFGVEAGPHSTIALYCVDRAGRLTEAFRRKVPGFCFLHDFAFTPNYRIFSQNPVQFAPLAFLLGMQTAAACIDLKPNTPTRLLVFDRAGNLRIVETDPCFVFHHCNAYEDGDRLILDSVCYDDYPKLDPQTHFLDVDFDRVIPGRLCRYVIDPVAQTATRQVVMARSCEFPVVPPRCMGQPYRYAYLGATDRPTGNAPLQAIAKVDLQTGREELFSFAPRGFVSEPIFVPRGGAAEDDGWLLVLVFEAASARSQLSILDAAQVSAGPVARLHLKHHIPYGLHGSFTTRTWPRSPDMQVRFLAEIARR